MKREINLKKERLNNTMKLINLLKKKLHKKRHTSAFPKEAYSKYPDEWPYELKTAHASEHFENMLDSVNQIKNTVYPEVYFCRYQTAIQEAEEVIKICKRHEIGKLATITLARLLSERVQMTNAFLDRCTDAGNLPMVRNELIQYRMQMPRESCEYLESLIGFCA